MTTVQSGSRKPGQRNKISGWRRPAIPRAQTTCSTENKTNSTLEIMVKVELNTQDIVFLIRRYTTLIINQINTLGAIM